MFGVDIMTKNAPRCRTGDAATPGYEQLNISVVNFLFYDKIINKIMMMIIIKIIMRRSIYLLLL